MKSYAELAVELEAQIKNDMTNLGIKAEGMIVGINLLVKAYNDQVDEAAKLTSEPINAC